jgi:hypothetical protein
LAVLSFDEKFCGGEGPQSGDGNFHGLLLFAATLEISFCEPSFKAIPLASSLSERGWVCVEAKPWKWYWWAEDEAEFLEDGKECVDESLLDLDLSLSLMNPGDCSSAAWINWVACDSIASTSLNDALKLNNDDTIEERRVHTLNSHLRHSLAREAARVDWYFVFQRRVDEVPAKVNEAEWVVELNLVKSDKLVLVHPQGGN